MKQSKKDYIKFLALLGLIILYLLFISVFVNAACYPLNQSTENNVSAGAWELCGAPAVYNFTLNSNTKNAIYLNTSNVVLDCNNSRLHGNATGRGITLGYSGTRNQTLLNCKVDTFNLGIKFESGATTGLFNAVVNNTLVYNISGCGNAGIYGGGYGNVTINNSRIENNTNISNCAGTNPHGIYDSSAAAGNDNRSGQGWIIENTVLQRNANSGIQFNGEMYQTRIVMRNVTLANNRGSGINAYTLAACSFQDLQIYNNGVYGLNLWKGDAGLPSANGTYTRMTFSNNTLGDVILNNNTNNYIYNNTYNGSGSIVVGDVGVVGFRFYETVPIIITYVSGAPITGAYVNLTYPSPYPRNVTITATNVTIFNQNLTITYNDVYNVTNGTIESNVINKSILLDNNHKFAVGDFTPNTCNDLYTTSGYAYTCVGGRCIFPGSDCVNQTNRTS